MHGQDNPLDLIDKNLEVVAQISDDLFSLSLALRRVGLAELSDEVGAHSVHLRFCVREIRAAESRRVAALVKQADQNSTAVLQAAIAGVSLAQQRSSALEDQ
jgi:hypothetical protein